MSVLRRVARCAGAALPALLIAVSSTPAVGSTPVRASAEEPTSRSYSRAVPSDPLASCEPATCVDATAFGADGSDARSDSGALDAAAAAAASVRKTLWLPPGTYVVDRPWQPPSRLTIAGAGIDRTVLKLDWASRARFGHSFMIYSGSPGSRSRATSVTVRDLTVDGSRDESGCLDNQYSTAADDDPLRCPRNVGGGIGAGSGWTIRQVRFTNLNYFKVWLFALHGAAVLDSRFDQDDPGPSSSGGEDNIGGGGDSHGITLQGNRWAASAVGNAVDLTVARRVTVQQNESWRSALIFEGVTDSTIRDNDLHGRHAGISVKPNSAYAGSVAQRGIRQPRNVSIVGNRISDVSHAGVVLFYFPTEAHAAGQREPRTVIPGGGNVVRGNTVSRSSGAGIVAWACAGAVFNRPDVIEGNRITDVSWHPHRTTGQLGAFPSGCGRFDRPTGIAISGAAGTVVRTNTVIDTRVGAPMTSPLHPTTGPQTAHAVTIGTDNAHPEGAPFPVLGLLSPQITENLSGRPVQWNLPVPVSVSPVDERGGTVRVTGYGLDRTSPDGVLVGGRPATALEAESAADVRGLSTGTVTVPPGTGTVAVGLQDAAGRSSGRTVTLAYIATVDPTLPPSTVLLGTGSRVILTTNRPVGSSPASFAARRIVATVNGKPAQLSWVTATTLRLRTPVLEPGPATVVLWRDGVPGRADTTAVVAAAIRSLDRSSGPSAGGGTVRVTGSGFTGASSWRFGAQPATCTVASPTTASCTVPPGPVGPAPVRFDPAPGHLRSDTPAAVYQYRS